MTKLTWHLRQLLPLTYRTRYRDAGGRSWFCVWRMWLGRCYAVEHLALADGGN